MKRVLIADDDESIRWVLQKAVAGMGFAADLAEDGDKAIALLGKKRMHFQIFAAEPNHWRALRSRCVAAQAGTNPRSR